MGVLQELNYFFSLFFFFFKETKTKQTRDRLCEQFLKIGFHHLDHIQIIFPGHTGKAQFVLGEKKFLKIQTLQQL